MSDQFGLDDAYSLETTEDVKNLYRRWADTFDAGFITEMGYVYDRHLASLFAETAQLEPYEAVLDVGCGTGVGGVALRRHGSWPIDGLDLSAEMLHKAREKVDGAGRPVYRGLFEANLLDPLDLPAGGYGGVISVGTFTHGHVGPEAIDQLVTLVRPGGLLCLGINEVFFQSQGFGSHLDLLADRGLITPTRLVRVPIYDAEPGSHEHATDTALVALFSPETSP